MTPPGIEEPNEAERRWIAAHLEQARELAATHCGEPVGAALPSLAALDRLWLVVGDSLRASGGDPNPLINAVGLAVGQHLVARRRMEWAVVTDEYGTDMAVRCKTSGAQVFPANLVAKRWPRGSAPFVEATVTALEADIEILQTAAGMLDEP